MAPFYTFGYIDQPALLSVPFGGLSRPTIVGSLKTLLSPAFVHIKCEWLVTPSLAQSLAVPRGSRDAHRVCRLDPDRDSVGGMIIRPIYVM